MRETFTTTVPDSAGVLNRAAKCICENGGNITRLSYNRAIDLHTMFIEVEAEAERLDRIKEELKKLGYLSGSEYDGRVLLLEFTIEDEPGKMLPMTQLMEEYDFNISYINSMGDGSGYQKMKFGIFVENPEKVSRFLNDASKICGVRTLDYDSSEKILDNTVFYVSFADYLAKKMGLSHEVQRDIIINSNLIMQRTDEENNSPYKTFEYIGKFAEYVNRYKGESFSPRIARYELKGVNILLIEPQCGSNTCVIEKDGKLLFADSGFRCYKEETLRVLREQIPGFDRMRKYELLTHPDVDHCGLWDIFDKVYVSLKSYENYRLENAGESNLREINPVHLPYIRLSKLLTGYEIPATSNMEVIGGTLEELKEPLEHIGYVNFEGLEFKVYEGACGHTHGEIICIEESLKIAFTGDIYVNIKGFSPEQAEFNRVAPYLMSSVDQHPKIAALEREEFLKLLTPGKWLVFGGHGLPKEVMVE